MYLIHTYRLEGGGSESCGYQEACTDDFDPSTQLEEILTATTAAAAASSSSFSSSIRTVPPPAASEAPAQADDAATAAAQTLIKYVYMLCLSIMPSMSLKTYHLITLVPIFLLFYLLACVCT